MDHTGAGLGWLGWAGVATSVRIKVMQDTGDQQNQHHTCTHCSYSQGNTCLILLASKWLSAIRPFGLISHDPGLVSHDREWFVLL